MSTLTAQAPHLRCHRLWESKISNLNQNEMLFAVVYIFELYPTKSWGSALSAPVNLWEAPSIVKKRKTVKEMATYLTCAIMNCAELRQFMEHAGMHSSIVKNTSDEDKNNCWEDNHQITPVFERLLPSTNGQIKAIELEGETTRYSTISTQYAYVVPFGPFLLNENEESELFTKAYAAMRLTK